MTGQSLSDRFPTFTEALPDMSSLPTLPDKLTRRERERLMRRQEILQAARAVFAEKGYTNATLDEVAQRAEFGKGTLYNYFEGGKEEILFAIFDEIYTDLGRLIDETFALEKAAGRAFRAVFHDFVVAFMDYFLERRELFMILVKEAYRMVFSDDRERAAYFQGQSHRMVEALVPTLEHAIARGEIRPLAPHAVAHMILGNINGLQMHVALQGGQEICEGGVPYSSEAAADFLTTMLCDGLLAHPEPYLAPQPSA